MNPQLFRKVCLRRWENVDARRPSRDLRASETEAQDARRAPMTGQMMRHLIDVAAEGDVAA